ncbi:MAG: DUF2461 domain-containing protein [Ignavibacteria bacterium]|nr:DUF2461 domain-containing protein [Ignavibacteria bacterium]
MTKAPFDEMEFYPPFEGFPREGIRFLQRLKMNNNREWFQKHKAEYEELVKLPMQSLIVEMGSHFHEFAPDIDADPKRSLFRIYRDVRFSKDKRPYKTHVAAHFVRRGKPKGLEGLGYYLHIEPGEVFLGGGIYIPSSDQLKKIRAAIVSRSEEFLKVVGDRKLKRAYATIEGEKLTRVPQGFDPEHPLAEWLKHKQFWVGVSWPENKSHRQTFAKEAAETFKAAAPLVEFLVRALS